MSYNPAQPRNAGRFAETATPADQRASAPPPADDNPADTAGWERRADWYGVRHDCLIDPDIIEWATGIGLVTPMTGFDRRPIFALHGSFDPAQIVDCYRNRVTADEWARLPAGTIIIHPTACSRSYPRHVGDDHRVVFHSYNPDSRCVTYTERGSTYENTMTAEWTHLTRIAPTVEETS